MWNIIHSLKKPCRCDVRMKSCISMKHHSTGDAAGLTYVIAFTWRNGNDKVINIFMGGGNLKPNRNMNHRSRVSPVWQFRVTACLSVCCHTQSVLVVSQRIVSTFHSQCHKLIELDATNPLSITNTIKSLLVQTSFCILTQSFRIYL